LVRELLIEAGRSGPQPDQRLVDQMQFAMLQRRAQVNLQGVLPAQLLVPLGCEEAVGLTPPSLGAIQGQIGVLQQLVRIVSLAGADRNADAGAHAHGMPSSWMGSDKAAWMRSATRTAS
jgi:hypothetical protein